MLKANPVRAMPGEVAIFQANDTKRLDEGDLIVARFGSGNRCRIYYQTNEMTRGFCVNELAAKGIRNSKTQIMHSRNSDIFKIRVKLFEVITENIFKNV